MSERRPASERMPESHDEIKDFDGCARFRLLNADGTEPRLFGHAEGPGEHLMWCADRVEAVGLILRSYDNRHWREFRRERGTPDSPWILDSGNSVF